MTPETRHTFKRELNALGDVSRFIGTFIADRGIDPGVQFFVDLAVEEVFSNMVKYNPDGAEEIEIGLSEDGVDLTVVLIDNVSEPFDLTQYEANDVKAALHERTPGGLGIYLVQRMMDEVYYEYKDHQSKITLIKKLAASHA